MSDTRAQRLIAIAQEEVGEHMYLRRWVKMHTGKP